MANQERPLRDLIPKRGMRYRTGISILRRPRFDLQIYRAWTITAGSTKIFNDLTKGRHLVDRVLAQMIKVARDPNVSKHLKSSLAGNSLFNFVSAVKVKTVWAKNLKTGIFMDFLYQLIHAHKMYVLYEHEYENQVDGYSLTAKEISAFLAEHQRNWQMVAQERENYLLTEAHVRRQEKKSPLQEKSGNILRKAVTQKAILKGIDTMELHS